MNDGGRYRAARAAKNSKFSGGLGHKNLHNEVKLKFEYQRIIFNGKCPKIFTKAYGQVRGCWPLLPCTVSLTVTFFNDVIQCTCVNLSLSLLQYCLR